MRILSAQPNPFRCVAAVLLCAWAARASAEPIVARHLEGTIHAFLEIRSEGGQVLASGDLIQVVHGAEVTAHTIFHFKDGSIDDETTVFSQRRNFQLIADRHIQKGPSFPHPMDVSVDCRGGQVVVRFSGKDGKEEVSTDHLKLPPDLANGLVPYILENAPEAGAQTVVSMVVATPKPRIVKLEIASHGEEPFSVVGSSHEALHYEIKIDLGGVSGVVAPLIGKQPPNIQAWIIAGEAPTFIREQGPLYPEGPIVTIELASPVWPDGPRSGG